ncbi:MAG: SufD family Fe-S cluster assembly protein [Actinomycetota bacterium]|nr:SufD family Fe-S cluster assembly protein [Actinomycetota bacterium]
MRSRRRAAIQRFETAALPTDSAEEWRYSRVGDLELDRYRPVVTRPDGPVRLPAEVIALIGEGPMTLVVTVDGWATDMPVPPSGVELADLSTTDPDVVGSLSGEPDAFVTLNAALAPSPLRVRVAPRTVVDRPIVIVHLHTADTTATFARTVVEVGSQAEATVLEVMATADQATGEVLTVPVSELDVADAANLRYVHVQLLGSADWQIGLQASRIGRDATLTSTAVALGGHYARLRTDSALVGQGGTTRLLAAYFGAGEQMHDFRTVQDHRAPRASSDLVYKGAVANRSRSVYTGLIRVEKGAAGTNAMQTNRNLVLHEGAHAESVPNLEIEDNDVRCSHASAVGPIAADQRFYLESRGVPSDVAERLIALGFLDEILTTLPVTGTGAWLRKAVAAKLNAAEEVEAGLVAAGVHR